MYHYLQEELPKITNLQKLYLQRKSEQLPQEENSLFLHHPLAPSKKKIRGIYAR